MIEHFDVNRIIGIEVFDQRSAPFAWLPRKQKTWIFGIKRKAWHDEGFYQDGCYYEGYMGDSWEANAYTKEELMSRGYLVDSDNRVWHPPHATVYLESDCKVTKRFNTISETNEWVDELKKTSGKTFEIVIHG